MSTEGYKGIGDLPLAEVNVHDNYNTVSINNCTFNIPDTIAKELTNIAVVILGFQGGASIAKTSRISPIAKLSIFILSGMTAGVIVIGTNAVNSI